MDSTLKERLVEALQYPRGLMQKKASPVNRPGEAAGEICIVAEMTGEGQVTRDWILSVKEISEFKKAPLNTLVSALGVALKSVQEELNESEHDLFCACDACAWQRHAGSLYSEARCHPDLGPPPIPR